MKVCLKARILHFAFCISAAMASAAPVLPRILESHAVFQRGAPIILRGRAEPGEAVSVAFGDARVRATAGADGRWEAALAPMEASAEGRDLVVAGLSGTLTLSDVVVGDVWIVAGDAFGPAVRKAGYDTKPLAQEALAHPEIRVVEIASARTDLPAPERAYDLEFTGRGSWHPLSQRFDRASLFPASLALRLAKRGEVPIGLVCLPLRSSALESAIPALDYRSHKGLEALADMAERFLPGTEAGRMAIDAHLDALDAWAAEAAEALDAGRDVPAERPDLPHLKETDFGSSFNAMVAPLEGLACRGVVWLASPHIEDGAELRSAKARALADSWRTLFRRDLPFFVVEPKWGDGVTAKSRHDALSAAVAAAGATLAGTRALHDGAPDAMARAGEAVANAILSQEAAR